MTHSTIKATLLYPHFNVATAAVILLFWIVVFAGEAFRTLPLDLTTEFWTILPPLLFPVWVRYKWDYFLWSKTLTLIPIATTWCSIVRYGINAHWTRLGTFGILSLNIAEAISKDWLSNRETWNRLNALSGLLLILTELPSIDTIHVRTEEPNDMLWSLGPCWIIAYTIWNLMFVYGNYAYSLGRHIAILLAPLALTYRNGWDSWIEARGYTLAFYFMIRCTFYDRLRAMTDIKIHATTERTRMMQVASLVCVAILLSINNGWRPIHDVLQPDVLHLFQGQTCLRENAVW